MSGYIGTQPVPQATQTRDSFTATANQTSFATSGYTPEFLDVFLNGVKLAASDYTATNGSDVVLASGAAASDILEVVAYTAFDTANVTGATNFTVTGAFTSQGIDDNGNATAITIDSNENVGIGTSSPNSPLEVSNGTENHRVAFGTGEVYLMARNASSYITQEYIANQHVFTGYGDNSSNEAMRIDASGNVLVGKTTTALATAGITLGESGFGSFTRSGFEPLNVNRLSSDGNLAVFYKDGTTVGSIGASGGDLIIGTGDTGVHFHDGVDSIIPWSVTAASYRNNAIDLGTASYSYRDLYLLGGIKFDTNGEFHDGYERGTFTPSVSGLTFTTAVRTDVKIGRVCHISINLSGSHKSRSADIYVSGLPFTASSGNYGANSVPLMEVSNISLGSGYTNMYGRINASDTRLQLLQSAGTAHANMNAGGGLNTGATLRASFTYQTNS